MKESGRLNLCVLATAFGLICLLASAPASTAGEPPIEAFDAGGLEARSAALILSGQEGGAIQVAALPLAWSAPNPETGNASILVLLEIDGESLLAVPGDEKPRDAEEILTEVHAYAVKPDGGLAGYFTQAFTFEPGLVARPDWAGVRFVGRLEVPPGEYALRLLVLRRATDRFALKSESFVVPEPGTDETARLLPPMFPIDPDAWLSVRMADLADEPWFNASPRPVVGPEETRTFLVAGRTPKGQMSPADLTVRILNGPEGEEMRRMELASLQPAGDVGGWSTYESGLDPTDLPPGTYRVEIAHEDSGAVAGLPLWIAPEADEDGSAPALPTPRVWTALLGRPDTLAPPEAVPALDAERRMRKMRKAEMEAFRDAYLSSLRHLIAGNLSEARSAIVEIERSKIEDGAREKDIARGQMLAAEMLADEESESLVPLIRLHLELYLDHLERGDYLLATHSRRMMEVLLHLYVESSFSSQADAIAASALVGLGQRLLNVGNLVEARVIFDRALEHRKGHAAALLGRVSIDETLGEFESAARHLRILVEHHPNHAEAWLRLAVNLQRIESRRPEEAREIYRRLVNRDDVEEWIAVLAYEELARALAADRDIPTAVSLLQRGLERFPGQARLYIYLAALHDRAGRLRDGREVLATLERRMATGGIHKTDSPRFRYGEWPEHAFEASRRHFAAIVSARLPRLAEALAHFQLTGTSGGGV